MLRAHDRAPTRVEVPMRWSDILLRFLALFRRREMDEDLADELQFHLEMQARKNRRYDVSLSNLTFKTKKF